MTILIVDDNPAVRRLIATVLSPLAATLVERGDGPGAIAAYRTERPDVVLMDLAMDGQDGIATTAALLAVDSAARVVIVTNHDGAELREAAARAGSLGYVLKEHLLELPGVVERALQRRTCGVEEES